MALPHTFRPLGARIAVFVFGGLLLLVTVVIWFAFPPEIRARFTPFQIALLAVFDARETSRRCSIRWVLRPASGEAPNPGRSRATTRPNPDSGAPT